MKLSDKEAVGVYLLLRDRAIESDETMARLTKRIEDSLLRELTVTEVENLQDVYRSMQDLPFSEQE